MNSFLWASVVAQLVKNPPAMQETQVRSLGEEDPLEKGMATHSSILAGESCGQRSPVSCSPRGRKSRARLRAIFLSIEIIVTYKEGKSHSSDQHSILVYFFIVYLM